MDNFVDKRDFDLLEADKYTFAVLRRIIDKDCEVLLSDHEKLIVCFSGDPYPVWIWTRDNAPIEDFEKAYKVAKENSILDGNHTINLKYELAEFLINKLKNTENELIIIRNMFAYECLNPIKPIQKSDGNIHQCNFDDIEEIVELMDLFHTELDVDISDRDTYRENAKKRVNDKNIFFWKDNKGENVAICNYSSKENLASIGLVYTHKEYRRKHYAQNLVYEVTKYIKDLGLTPMLYTDADYIASNSCYMKIGYELRGKLCTIGKKKG